MRQAATTCSSCTTGATVPAISASSAARSFARCRWPLTRRNCLHWVHDVTEGEDLSSVRTGHGPHVMAALRNTAINIIRLRGETNIAAAHRAFSYRPTDVFDALTAA
jgi:hypothetical protein